MSSLLLWIPKHLGYCRIRLWLYHSLYRELDLELWWRHYPLRLRYQGCWRTHCPRLSLRLHWLLRRRHPPNPFRVLNQDQRSQSRPVQGCLRCQRFPSLRSAKWKRVLLWKLVQDRHCDRRPVQYELRRQRQSEMWWMVQTIGLWKAHC
jgi:hypothetical protein